MSTHPDALRRGPLGPRARWGVVALVAAALLVFAIFAAVTGLSRGSAEEEVASPATVRPLAGGLHRLELTAQAVKRVGIATAPVRSAVVASRRSTVIPYSAVLYDANGNSWTYTSPTPLTFVRRRVMVARVSAGKAYLASGPRAGTKVVTVGAAELFGTEFEFDEE